MKVVNLGTSDGKELNINCLVYEPDSLYHGQWADKLKVGSHMLRMARTNPYLFYRTYIERKAPLPESKAEYDIGHAVEALVCGWPERVVCSDFQTRCKGHNQIAAEQPDNTVLTVPEYELCHYLALELQANEGWKVIIRSGSAQIAARINMGEFYLQGKFDWIISKPDSVQRDLFETSGPVIADIKTTARLRHGYGNFFKQIETLGYLHQAALYQVLHEAITGVIPKWYWVVVEKEWPRESTIVQADEDRLEDERHEIKQAVSDLGSRFAHQYWDNHPGIIESMYGENCELT